MTKIPLHDSEAAIVRREAEEMLTQIAGTKKAIAELEAQYAGEAGALKGRYAALIAPHEQLLRSATARSSGS
jgi:hypothetical protein